MNDQQSPSWIEKLAELRAAGRPCAMVVVTAVRGSAPREPGARMLLCGGELVWGTIGGGNLEKLAIEHVAALLERPGNLSETVVYPLAEKTGPSIKRQSGKGHGAVFLWVLPLTVVEQAALDIVL